MEKLKILNKIKELYAKGENIVQYLKANNNSSKNNIEDILISYDFQSGSYINFYKNNIQYYKDYCGAIAKVINPLGDFSSIIEVGVGEATTLGNLIENLKRIPTNILGFDISWSRIKYAKQFMQEKGIPNSTLFTGDLFEIPLKDNSVDIVYTSHSIEPNGGREKEALQELYRITNKYLILLEPSYTHASDEGKKRMLSHGYITTLPESARELGYEIIEHRLFDTFANPLNPTGLLIIKKGKSHDTSFVELACPLTKSSLEKFDNVYYSDESLLCYPIIKNIPCLLSQNAIIATHFK